MIRIANQFHRNQMALDLLIVARGGGSIEDLWAFNDEKVAYAIFESELPVITGIGHEVDFTIADFVADVRAPTPSAAAAMVTPDQNDVKVQLASAGAWLADELYDLIDKERRQTLALEQRLARLHPQRLLDLRRQQLDEREHRLEWTTRRHLDRLRDRVESATQQLEALNPQRVLGRGYSIVQRLDGGIVTGPQELAHFERLHVRAAAGGYEVEVIKTDETEGGQRPLPLTL
jgi:exodeoxyribonuclease VII large subunit